MIKVKGIRSIAVLLIVFLSSSSIMSFGQATKDQTDEIKLFEHGKMLYIKKLYVPALADFEQFLHLNSYPNLTHEAETYKELCRLRLDKKNAANKLVKLVKAHPEHKINTEVNYELGLYHFRKGKYRRALKYLEVINEKDVAVNQREELIFKKGYSYFKKDKYEEAKREFAKILNGNGPYAVQANYYYGYQCYVLKDYHCALRTFEKIGDKGPKTMRLYMAQIYYEQEEYEKAFDILKDIKIKSKENEINLLQGKIQYQLKHYSIALSHFDKYEGDVSKLFPDEIYQFAHANFLAEKYDVSTKYYLMVSNQENHIGQASNYYLGVSDVNIGKKNRAMNAFAEAKRKQFDPEITELAAFNYAKLAAELQKNNVAIKAIQQFLNNYPDSEYNSEAQKLMSSIYLRTKNYKAAIEVIEKIPNMDRETKKAYQLLTYHRAEELFLNKEYKLSNTFFKKSIRLLHKAVKKELWNEFDDWFDEIGVKGNKIPLIGTGGNINKLLKMLRKKNEDYFIQTADLKQLYKDLKSIDYDERIVKYILNPDRADVIVPACKIFLKVAKHLDAPTIYIPKVGLSDGIARSLYREFKAQQL